MCIEKRDCSELDEATCKGRLGCVALYGHLPMVPRLVTSDEYVGCGNDTDNPGATVTCTASGPDGPCWVMPTTWVPSGWLGWNCGGGPTSFAECMQQSPFGSN
jgi:hypothetical protein